MGRRCQLAPCPTKQGAGASGEACQGQRKRAGTMTVHTLVLMRHGGTHCHVQGATVVGVSPAAAASAAKIGPGHH